MQSGTIGPGVRPPGSLARGLCHEDADKILDAWTPGRPGRAGRLQDGGSIHLDAAASGVALVLTVVLTFVAVVLALLTLVFALVAQLLRREPGPVLAVAAGGARQPGIRPRDAVP